MDGWKDHYIAQCNFGFKSGFRKNGERCRTEYSEGTAVARGWFGVLVGYCRGNGDGHVRLTWFYKGRWSCLIDHRISLENQMSFPPFPRDFTIKVF
jgi:hypothetical protein